MSINGDGWQEMEPMIREGRTQAEMAKSLGLTVGQLRYRLRKFRQEITASTFPPEGDHLPEEAGADLLYNDETWISRYNKDVIVALPKDPHTLFVYWDVSERRKRVISECFQCEWNTLPKILRCCDVTDIHFDGSNAHRIHQQDVHRDSGDWFFTALQAGRNYVVDFGTTTIHNQFFVIVRSSVVALPADGPIPVQGLAGIVRKHPVGLEEQPNEASKNAVNNDGGDRQPMPWADRFTGYSLS